MKYFWSLSVRDFDRQLFLAMLLLCAIGVAMVYSASQVDNPLLAGLWQKQVVWIILGLLAAAVAVFVPFRYFQALAWPLYFLALGLLILVLFAPAQARAHRWFNFGSFQLQPSEMAKVATVFIVARTLTTRSLARHPIQMIVAVCGLVLLPMALVLIEPDLGTSLVFPVFLLGMLFWARVPVKTLFFMLSPLLSVVAVVSMPSWVVFMAVLAAAFWLFKIRFRVAAPLFLINTAVGCLAPVFWNHLREYQQRRILIFINPGLDPRGAGWHVLQSKIAIGSGGLWGKGFLQGTQKNLSFLPAQHTDFVFSTLGEEFGLLGVLAVLAIFSWLIYRGLAIAQQARNGFASLTTVGLMSIVFFHVFLNIGMTLGLLPVTGIPLPFLSYGGSSTIAMMTMVGIVLNVGLRRYEY